MNEAINEVSEKSIDFKSGFEEGFHKGIVQGYIKGHTDATEEFKIQQEKSFIAKMMELIIKVIKDSVFINIPLSSLISAIRSLFKVLPQLFQLSQIGTSVRATAIPQTA